MNLLAELKQMLQPVPMPEGAVTVQDLSEQLGIARQSAKGQLDRLVQSGTLTSRVIRTHNSGGKVCEVTIYEKPTRAPSNSTTSPGASG